MKNTGETDTQRRRGNVTMETEVGVLWSQMKEHLQPPEAGRGKVWILP